jgi:hypothetical protein
VAARSSARIAQQCVDRNAILRLHAINTVASRAHGGNGRTGCFNETIDFIGNPPNRPKSPRHDSAIHLGVPPVPVHSVLEHHNRFQIILNTLRYPITVRRGWTRFNPIWNRYQICTYLQAVGPTSRFSLPPSRFRGRHGILSLQRALHLLIGH